MKIHFSFAVLAVALSAVAHAGSEDYTAVSLIDINEFARLNEDFRSRADAKDFREFTELVYDPTIGRPWSKEDYKEQINSYWKKVAATLCSEFSSDCGLQKKKADPELLDETFKSHFKSYFSNSAHGRPYFLDFVHFPSDSNSETYNAWMSARESSKRVSARFWDLSSNNLVLKEKDYTFVYDLETYAAAYAQAEVPRYFAWNDEGEAVLNVAQIKKNATDFAPFWKARSAASSWDRMLDELYQRNSARFENVYAKLVNKLSKLPNAGAELARFKAERQKNDYPTEVYQHVGYSLFREILGVQAQYYALAVKGRTKLGPERKVWESLLAAQKNTDPKAVLFLVAMSTFPSATVLAQTVTPAIAVHYYVELLNAILGLQEFSGKAMDRLEYALRSDWLFEEKFLQEEAPELYAKLWNPKTGKLKKVSNLNADLRREVYTEYMYKNLSENRIRIPAVRRMIDVLAKNLRDEDASLLAEHVHQVREPEFTAPPKFAPRKPARDPNDTI